MVWRIASTTNVRGWRSKRSLTSDLSSSPLTLGRFRRGSALICASLATPVVVAVVAVSDVVSSVDAFLEEVSSGHLVEEQRAESSPED